MKGLMMEYQLTLPAIFRGAETLFGKKEIVTCLPAKSIHRYTYNNFTRRAKKLAVALHELGIRHGDRVATLSWNHYQQLEAYVLPTPLRYLPHSSCRFTRSTLKSATFF